MHKSLSAIQPNHERIEKEGGISMDQTLAYLHEVLSNYTEDHKAIQAIDEQMVGNNYSSEGSFVRSLDEEDIRLLEQILEKEIHHANAAGDYERSQELNEVYELLY